MDTVPEDVDRGAPQQDPAPLRGACSGGVSFFGDPQSGSRPGAAGFHQVGDSSGPQGRPPPAAMEKAGGDTRTAGGQDVDMATAHSTSSEDQSARYRRIFEVGSHARLNNLLNECLSFVSICVPPCSAACRRTVPKSAPAAFSTRAGSY